MTVWNKMKESWMEKLIELLNEYEWYTDIPTWTLSWANEPLYWWWTAYASAYLIPSKKYWFIERLVENDKIDKDKVIELEHNWIRPFKLDNLYWEIKLEERLLMLLSISSSPIEDLIFYLKK